MINATHLDLQEYVPDKIKMKRPIFKYSLHCADDVAFSHGNSQLIIKTRSGYG